MLTIFFVLDLYDFQFTNEYQVFSLTPKQYCCFFSGQIDFRFHKICIYIVYESEVSRVDRIKWSGETMLNLIYAVNISKQNTNWKVIWAAQVTASACLDWLVCELEMLNLNSTDAKRSWFAVIHLELKLNSRQNR